MAEINVGERVRAHRKKLGLTTKDIAEALGTTDATISRLEGGKQQITVSWLFKFATVLGVDAAELLGSGSAVEYVPVVGQIRMDYWTDKLLFGKGVAYVIPAPALAIGVGGNFEGLEVYDKPKTWLISKPVTKAEAGDFIGESFAAVRVDGGGKFERSLRKLVNSKEGLLLIADEGDASQRSVRLNDERVVGVSLAVAQFSTFVALRGSQ
jgi:DNA-binding XRE family transcriptional regulator